jgi:glycosyltransferase involved in cell wall biosynthesis
MPRVVIGHDFLETYGGAERVTQEMARAFPDAPVHAILARPSVARRMGIEDRVESLLPARERLFCHYRLGAPLYPALVGAARLPAADVLLTSSYAFAHRFHTANDAPQLCYCHSPLRFAWTMTAEYQRREAAGGPAAAAFLALAAAMRRGDRRASRRVARYLTQSPHVAERIARFYGRTATVIGAPVDGDVFAPGAADGDRGYFLFSGRLVEPYKRAAATIEAFRRLGEPLVIAGDGPALPELRAAAPPNVSFAGHLEDAGLVELMRGCRALVFPSEDDFGLIPLEAMACGRPVLAYRGGGALHTVIPGVTGELFPSQDPDSIAAAVAAFDPDRYRAGEVREHALQWDRPVFRRRLIAAVEELAR